MAENNISENKADNKIKNKLLGSFVWSIGAACLYQGILQLIIYPLFNKWLGAAVYGDALTLISIISIISFSIGGGMNYSRIVMSSRKEVTNGDYNLYSVLCAVICIPVAALSVYFVGGFSLGIFLAFALVLILSFVRMYVEVDFRLDVNFKGSFIFYVFLSLGYIVGLVPVYFGFPWEWEVIAGEIFAILFVVFAGKILRRPFFKRSEYTKEVFGSCTALVLVNILSNFILNSDRILIKFFEGGEAVSVFYTSSLLGKCVALLVVPLSSVILSFLTKYNQKMTKKFFALISGASILLGAVVFAACTIASPIFVKILYPNLYESCKEYFALANLGQVLYFISNMLSVIALRFMKESWQLYINIGYTIVFFAIGIPAIIYGGLYLFAWAIIVTNLIRLLVVIGIGIVTANSDFFSQEEEKISDQLSE